MNDEQLSQLFVMGITAKHTGNREVGEEILEKWKCETKRKEPGDRAFVVAVLVVINLYIAASFLASLQRAIGS